MSEKYTRSFFYIGVILILFLVPVSQIIPTNFVQPQTASATGGIVLNGTKTTSATVVVPILNVTLSNFNVGTSNDRVLIVGVESSDAGVSSITFGGTSLTKAVSHFTNSDAEFWYLANPSGIHNIVVTMSGPTKLVIGAYSFFGASQTNPIPTHATSFANSTGSPTISITTANANSWVLDSAAIYGGVTLGSPTCTQRWDINVSGLEPPHKITGASSSTIKASAGSVTCGWTASSGDLWDDVAIEVKASTAPGAPTNPTSTATSTTQLKISWTAPSDNGGSSITGYKIQRASTAWVDVTNNTGSTLTNYNVTSLAANSVYKFHIAAWNHVGLGTYSSNVTGTTLPNSPTSLTATTISSSQINLSWTAPTGGNGTLNGYKIESSTNGGSTWSTIVANTTNTGTTYSNTGLASGTTYTYRVSALNNGGASSPSSTASATTSGTSSSWHSSTGILEPLYCDPYSYSDVPSTCTNISAFKWQSVNDSATAYPHVPFFVIVNPDNGPGNGTGGNCSPNYSSFQNRTMDYQHGIGNLTKAGVIVLGYVRTDWDLGGVPYTTATSWIDQWAKCYKQSGVKGIFLDEMSNNPTSGILTYYQNLTNYIHSKFAYSIGNPGDETSPSFIGTVDKMVIYENTNSSNTCGNINKLDNATLQGFNITSNNCNSGSDNTGFPIDSWHTQYDKSNFSYLEYNKLSITKNEVQKTTPWVSLLFITSDTPSTVWTDIPSYLNSLTSYLNNTSASLHIQSLNDSNNNSTITGFDQLIYQGSSVSNYTLTRSQAFTPVTYNATQGWPYAINATKLAVHAGNCMVPDYWVYNNIRYSNPVTVTTPSGTATLNVYYRATNTGC